MHAQLTKMDLLLKARGWDQSKFCQIRGKESSKPQKSAADMLAYYPVSAQAARPPVGLMILLITLSTLLELSVAGDGFISFFSLNDANQFKEK